MSEKTVLAQPTRPGWTLYCDLFEVHWKRGPKGFYADRVRIMGTTFHYLSGKKAYGKAATTSKKARG